MCASVCPSQALAFGTQEEIERLRPNSTPVNQFKFGDQTIVTKVRMMTPRHGRAKYVDVTDVMEEEGSGKTVSLNVLENMNM